MIWAMVRLALQAIRRNVLRSSLTVLGIVIGVAAVIAMVTIGAGATAKVSADLANLGMNILMVRPGQGQMGPGGARSEAAQFELEDARALLREVPGLSAVAPTSSQPAQAISGSSNWSTTVTGSTTSFLSVRKWTLETGRAFTESEERAGKAVCIIGATVRRELFRSRPVGERMRVGKPPAGDRSSRRRANRRSGRTRTTSCSCRCAGSSAASRAIRTSVRSSPRARRRVDREVQADMARLLRERRPARTTRTLHDPR
jgi:putative ABC transport system permease protein